MNRLKKATAANRAAAQVQREAGREEAAVRLEARAGELESGRLTDRTDDALAIVRFAFRR
ncbi:hypothetical protein [Streptomyces rhizosphaerihabitans]|uniref:hypothetical protein n=1 Tax=Streptomyces rhizosphaerihabitans TaxID=1266770 RepID=UPI0021C03AFB|nr:hypothetical protein [Streptomyces rhizosphaerihabitans]MCT9003474.1 hypothetical protein [Streptomyces rhizosphaerihabitans]